MECSNELKNNIFSFLALLLQENCRLKVDQSCKVACYNAWTDVIHDKDTVDDYSMN